MVWILCLILLNIGIQIAHGADIELTSVVNSTNITLNDQLILTVTVSGSDANKVGKPELDPMPEFTISDIGTSSETSITNFRVFFYKNTYTYTLFPEKTGIFDVGAVSIKVGNETITAPSTKVKVISGPAPQIPTIPGNQSTKPAGDDNIFINTFTDKKEAYVGEQITFTFELYNRLSLSTNEYEPPSTTGFWTVDLPQIPASRKITGNREYIYNVIKTALLPTTSGELTIGPSTFIYTVQRGFFTTGESLPVTGKPDNFDGAVGNFAISSSVDNANVRVGDVVTVQVSLTGTGNIDLISSLTEPDLSAFKMYDPKVTEKISNSGFVVGGVKTWEYVIIPKKQGITAVEPFSLTFFNPEDNNYHTVFTQPLELNVVPGDAIAASGTVDGDRRGSIEKIAADIRYIKPNKEILENTRKHIYSSSYFYLLYILPLVMLITSFAVKKRQDTIERNTGLKRKLNAWKNAQKRLNEASKMLNNNDIKGLYGKLHEAITFYIGDMLNIDTGTLIAVDLERFVRNNGIAPEFAEHIRKTLEMCDFVRFASVGAELKARGNIVQDTRDIIARLKDAL